ncbi:MAG: hypothetical protein MJ252_22160 [archaeon]|nr:hypothetical protein [archaeon]
MGQNESGDKHDKPTDNLLCPECSKRIPKFKVFVENSIAKVQIECECNAMRNFSGVMEIGEYMTKINNIDTTMLICPNHGKIQNKFCVKCEKWLCKNCGSKDHCVLPKGVKKEDEYKPKEVKCNAHQQPSTNYCGICKTFLCEECKEIHNRNLEEETTKHQLIFYPDLLTKESILSKYNFFVNITTNSECYRTAMTKNFLEFLNKYISNANSAEEKTKIENLKKRMNDRTEANKEACNNIKIFFIRLLHGIYIGKDKTPFLGRENIVYNLIINSTFNESLLGELNQRLMEVNKYNKRYSEDFPFLEEQINKYIDYLSSTFLMFTLNNDLYKVYPSTIKANGDISAICIIENDKIAVAVDSVINIYNTKNSASLFALKGHFNEVTFIHKINSEKIISASLDKTLKIWNVNKKNLFYSFNMGTTISTIFKSPSDENVFFMVHYFTKYEVINLSDVKNPKVISKVNINEDNIYESYEQLNNGDIICGAKGRIGIYPFNFGGEMVPIKKFSGFEGTPLSFCEIKNKLIAVGLSLGGIILLDFNDAERIKMNGHKGGVTGLIKLKSNEDILVSSSLDCTIKFWNLKSDTCQETFHLTGMEVMFFKQFENGYMAMATDKEVSTWQGCCYK